MNTQSTLSLLARVEELIDSEKSSVEARGKTEFWQRDKTFISKIRDGLLADDPERVRWAFDQMRNLSQGFGAYCRDLTELDGLLDELCRELSQLVSTR